MTTHRIRLSLLATCATICLVTPSVSHAANTTCANADFLFLGERAQYSISANSSLYFKTRVRAGRSYAVMTWGPFQDVSEGGVVLNVELFNSACSAQAGGANGSDHEPSLVVGSGHDGDVDSIIPTEDGTLYISVTNWVASTYLAHVLAIETTLFSPWWFTGGTNQAFIEVRNNMSAETTVRVTLYRSDGSVCGATAVSVAGDGNAAISVTSVGDCGAAPSESALSGSAQIAFGGTPGGMAANITTIDVVNGTSFDAPFTPRMVWSTFSR